MVPWLSRQSAAKACNRGTEIMFRAVTLAVCFVLFPSVVHALVVGQEGNVYDIEEIDIAVLIQAKAAQFDFAQYAEENKRQLADRVKTFRPADAVRHSA